MDGMPGQNPPGLYLNSPSVSISNDLDDFEKKKSGNGNYSDNNFGLFNNNDAFNMNPVWAALDSPRSDDRYQGQGQNQGTNNSFATNMGGFGLPDNNGRRDNNNLYNNNGPSNNSYMSINQDNNNNNNNSYDSYYNKDRNLQQQSRNLQQRPLPTTPTSYGNPNSGLFGSRDNIQSNSSYSPFNNNSKDDLNLSMSDSFSYQDSNSNHNNLHSPSSYNRNQHNNPQHQYVGNSYSQHTGRTSNVRPQTSNISAANRNSISYAPHGSTGGSNAQGRAINKMLLEILRERIIDPQRLDLAIETYIERMDCVNLATLLFHTGKKRLLLSPSCIKRIALRMNLLKEELRSREASNALYGLKCMCSEVPEVRELVLALANKVAASSSEFVAQAVGNALYGCQMMTSDYEEVRYLLLVLAAKVGQCGELLEAQNIGNALYGLRGMNSDYKEVRAIVSAITPKIATAREELNGQALGNSLYGLQSMSSKESEVRRLLAVLATKATRTWEELKAQEVGNALYGLKRMSTDVPEVRILVSALISKIASSAEILDAQAIGNSFYGMQNMQSDSPEVLSLLNVLAEKVVNSCPELDGQAMGNSLYGLQGMRSEHQEVRTVVSALTDKLLTSCLDLNAQEMGNALYGLQNMDSECMEVRRLIAALSQKVISSQHELTSQEIGNAMFGLQGMSSSVTESRMLIRHIAYKTMQSHSVLDPQGVSNSLLGTQRMSSDSEDVRMLIETLANKIEHSWKLLSAQHVSNALYGAQHLSSDVAEVQHLLKALLPKIISCRDEMTAKHLSFALFGLQNFSSEHGDVLAVVAALTEKLSLCKDQWSVSALCTSLYGLQSLSSDKEEVTLLLAVLNNIILTDSNLITAYSLASQGSANSRLEKLDSETLSNAILGLQRMSTKSKEVVELLSYFAPLFNHVSSISVKACANIIYGLQGCSCSLDTTQLILAEVAKNIQVVIGDFTSALVTTSSGGLTTCVSLFKNIVNLYQSMALSLFVIPDKESLDSELHTLLNTQLSSLESIVERHGDLLSNGGNGLHEPRDQTIFEHRLSSDLLDCLQKDHALKVSLGVLVKGFHMAVYITLDPLVKLQTANGNPFDPHLNLEVRGSSYSNTAKAHFFHLRKKYLEEVKGLTVETLACDSCVERMDNPSYNPLTQCDLRYYSPLLNSLRPATKEDAELFFVDMEMRGLPLTEGSLLTSPTDLLSREDPTREHNLNTTCTRAFQFQHFTCVDGMNLDHQLMQSPLVREFFDDDFDCFAQSLPTSNVSSLLGGLAPHSPRAVTTLPPVRQSSKSNLKFRNGQSKPILGMALGWLGDWPVVGFNAPPQQVGNISRQFLSGLNDKVGGSRYSLPNTGHGNMANGQAEAGHMRSPSVPTIMSSQHGSSPYRNLTSQQNSTPQELRGMQSTLGGQGTGSGALNSPWSDSRDQHVGSPKAYGSNMSSTQMYGGNLSNINTGRSGGRVSPELGLRDDHLEFLAGASSPTSSGLQRFHEEKARLSLASVSTEIDGGDRDRDRDSYHGSGHSNPTKMNMNAVGDMMVRSSLPPPPPEESGHLTTGGGGGVFNKLTVSVGMGSRSQESPRDRDGDASPAGGNEGEVDEEIALLEAQLEIARLEAKIKALKAKKAPKAQV